MVDTKGYLDFDPESYEVFFKQWDQKTSAAIASAFRPETFFNQIALPDEDLLSRSQIVVLRMAQFRAGVRSVPTEIMPDAFGNWGQPLGGTALSKKLWTSPKEEQLDWVCQLLGVVLTKYPAPARAAWDYLKPIGYGYLHATGDSNSIVWLQRWIESRIRFKETSSLYQIGNKFEPIVGGNFVSFQDFNGEGFEETLNKTKFSTLRLVEVGQGVANQINFDTSTSRDNKPTAPKVTLSPQTVLVLEGGTNGSGFSVNYFEQVETGLVKNRVSFSQNTIVEGGI